MRVVGGLWQLESVLGSGSFAIVWKARNIQTGQYAAIKEIHTSRLSGKLQASLASEVSVLQKTSHINLVGLLDMVQEDDRLLLVLEYCGGGDLGHYLRRYGQVTEGTARHLLSHLAEGLKAMRSLNLVHRDLKPQNLLLTDSSMQPQLKIADFGFARMLQPQGLAETLCGSPLYMAPEILCYHKYDAKADLWSVGAILFELLAGRPPYNGANHLQLLQNIERGEGGRLPADVDARLSPACKQLLHQLLRRNPIERLSYEEFFAHPFLTQQQQQQRGQEATAPERLLSSSAPHSSNMTMMMNRMHGQGQAAAPPPLHAQRQHLHGAAQNLQGNAAGNAINRTTAAHTARVAYDEGPVLGVHEATGITVRNAVMHTQHTHAASSAQHGSHESGQQLHGHAGSSTSTAGQSHLEYTDIDLGPSRSNSPALGAAQGNAAAGVAMLAARHEQTPGGLSVIEEVDDYVVVSTDPSVASSDEDILATAAAAAAGMYGSPPAGGPLGQFTGCGHHASHYVPGTWGNTNNTGAITTRGRGAQFSRLMASAASQLSRHAAAVTNFASHVSQAAQGKLSASTSGGSSVARTPPGLNRALSANQTSSSSSGGGGGYSIWPGPMLSRSASAGIHPGHATSDRGYSATPSPTLPAGSSKQGLSTPVNQGHTKAGTGSSSSSQRVQQRLQQHARTGYIDPDLKDACSTVPPEQLRQFMKVPDVRDPTDLLQRVLHVLAGVAVQAWDAAVTQAEVACEEAAMNMRSNTGADDVALASAKLDNAGSSNVAGGVSVGNAKEQSQLTPNNKQQASDAGAGGSSTSVAAARAAVAAAVACAAPVLRNAAAEFTALHLLVCRLLHAMVTAANESEQHKGYTDAYAGTHTSAIHAVPMSSSPGVGGAGVKAMLAAHARSILTPLQARSAAVHSHIVHSHQLPSSFNLMYQAASSLSRAAAMDEMLGQYTTSVQQYAKAADLLLLLILAGKAQHHGSETNLTLPTSAAACVGASAAHNPPNPYDPATCGHTTTSGVYKSHTDSSSHMSATSAMSGLQEEDEPSAVACAQPVSLLPGGNQVTAPNGTCHHMQGAGDGATSSPRKGNGFQDQQYMTIAAACTTPPSAVPQNPSTSGLQQCLRDCLEISGEQRAQAQQLYVAVRIRQTACMADLNARSMHA